jgi:hypothetical protein
MRKTTINPVCNHDFLQEVFKKYQDSRCKMREQNDRYMYMLSFIGKFVGGLEGNQERFTKEQQDIIIRCFENAAKQ